MPSPLLWRVFWQFETRETIKQLGASLPDVDNRMRFAGILRKLDYRLQREPLLMGEVYRSEGAVEHHLIVLDSVSINVAIDTQRRAVLVRTCHVLSGFLRE